MAKNFDIAKTKKIIWVLFAAVIVFLIVDVFVPSIIFKFISELGYFGCSIAILVYSIKLIKKKELKFGITFLVISALVIFYLLLAFVLGVIITLYGLPGV